MSRPKKNRPQSKANLLQKSISRLMLSIESCGKFCRLQFYRNLKKLKGKPKNLAKGLAIGVFAGCFPFFGLQSIIGVLLATAFRVNKVAAIAGTWISNPLTYIPLFVFNYKVGKLLLRIESISSKDIDFESLSSFMELGSAFAIALLSGSLVVGAIASIIGYFVGLTVFERLQTDKSSLEETQSQVKKELPINYRK